MLGFAKRKRKIGKILDYFFSKFLKILGKLENIIGVI